MAIFDLNFDAPSLATPSASSVVSVGDVVRSVGDEVSQLFRHVWIAGEVGNCSTSSAGHTYFTLKDDVGQINCVLFKGEAERHRQSPIAMGQKVEVRGVLGVYPKSGDLQIRLSDWRLAGLGALYEAYLARKAQLAREGLFDPDLKKPLPRFVKSIGLVTSPQGAVVHDVRRTLERRMPWTAPHRMLYSTQVQGEAAPAQIVAALKRADAAGHDVILLVRGGGSFEDLFCFNDETLVRTLRELKTPVVTGIGHEDDETLAGLASDLNASTPTAATELLGPSLDEWLGVLGYFEDVVTRRFEETFAYGTERVDRAEALLAKPPILERGDQALNSARVRLRQLMSAQLERSLEALERQDKQLPLALFRYQEVAQSRLTRAAQQLMNPQALVGLNATRLEQLTARLTQGASAQVEGRLKTLSQVERHFKSVAHQPVLDRAQRLDAQAQALAALSPERPLQLGYAMVEKAGVVEEGIAGIEVADELVLRMRDGTLTTTVTARRPSEKQQDCEKM